MNQELERLIYLRDLFIDGKDWQEVSRLQYEIDNLTVNNIYQKLDQKDLQEKLTIFLFYCVYDNLNHLVILKERYKV
jgi:hypothetical protein